MGESLLFQYAITNRFRAGRPVQISVAPDGKSVLFLRSGPRDFVQDLVEYDVAAKRERVLLSAHELDKISGEQVSEEEQRRRERTRQAARGITAYELSQDGRLVLATVGDRLFVIDRPSGAAREWSAEGPPPVDPRFSPAADRIACVRGGDLYVVDVEIGVAQQLTEATSPAITNGLSEFVAQEEMHRMRGYWWSPEGTQLAYQQTDEAEVETLYIADPHDPAKPPRAHRYPRAGTANASVRLGVIAASGGQTVWAEWDREQYPYLAGVAWEANAPLTIVVQNRPQTALQIRRVDPATGETALLLSEIDEAWLNLDQTFPRWLASGKGFLWMTERNGARQLELRDAEGALVRPLTEVDAGFQRLLHVDEPAGVAWIQATIDPTQTHIAPVRLDGAARGLVFGTTAVSGEHEAVFGEGADLLVHASFPFEGLPSWRIRRRAGDRLGEVVATLESAAEQPVVPLRREFSQVAAEPRYQASLVRPTDFDRARRYPVLLYVYGGPGVQVVKPARPSYPLDQWLADQGFIVVSVDGRGTPGRGRAWERAIKGDFATLPLEDQVRGLTALGEVHQELDLTRVGVFGWSFGGYMAAMAAARRPDVFRAAVIGAPVIDFADYDTHYTERYLGLPQENPEAYGRSNVLTFASQLTRPLLLIHGTADDNCYLSHSLRLSDVLFRHGIEHEFLPLAGQTHMVASPEAAVQLYEKTAAFFRRHLA